MNNVIRGAMLGVGGALAFSAHAANLVGNPDFTDGIDGWTIAGGQGAVTADAATGSPAAPSMQLIATEASPNLTVESTCMAVDDSNPVDLSMNAMGASGFAQMGVKAYGDADCTDDLNEIVASEALPIDANWTSFSLTDETLPDGTQSAKFFLTATTGASATPADVHFDHIAFGAAGSVAGSVNVNQEGLSGTWYNPATGGQGMEFTFSPDDTNPGEGTFFGAWYTYDIASSSASSQRWYSMQSVLSGDASSLDVTIYQNTGGNFDAPPSTNAVAVGTGTIAFDSCTTGSFTYSLDDGRASTVPLQRLMPNVNCVETGTPTNPSSDFGLTGTWYNSGTGGQGMMIEINPSDQQAFFGWYTYAVDGDADGASGQRWFSAQSPYTVGDRTMNLTLYASSGGSFDSPGNVVTSPVGTATLEFASCTSATLDYAFTDGEFDGETGTIELTRLGALPASCSTITQ